MRYLSLLLFAALAGCAAEAPVAEAPASHAEAPGRPPVTAGTECRVHPAGLGVWQGPCSFRLDGGHGSFVIAPLGSADFGGGIGVVMVGLDGSGSADVRGLTADGLSSRWGAARRSRADKGCWSGADFEICAWDRGAAAAREAAPAGEARSAPEGRAVRPDSGGQYWAVYVAVSDDGTAPELRQAEAALRALGLELGATMASGQLNCDVGSAAALHRSEDAFAVSVYFATEADARAFAASWGRPAVGVARVSPICLDG
ncbi:MAG: hypothetical protein JXX28_06715 [Deltaproteobacteria bacterium]|nr:hypothetical protein [Deltaproteobacteria bacterium]